MASGSTSWVGKWDNTHRYYMEWTSTSDIPNNASSVVVRIKLQLLSNSGNWNTQYQVRPWTMNVDGLQASGSIPQQTSYAPGGIYTLVERTFSVAHNTDGTKSFSISGSQDTPGGTGTVYMSGGPWTLDAIPRATTITSVGNIDTSSTSIAVTLSRKTASYTHEISLKIGSSVVASWSGAEANFDGAKNLSITATQRNNMLDAMPTSTSSSAVFTVITKNGATTVGTESKTITISVHSGAVPSLTTANFITTVSTYYQIAGTSKSVMAQNKGVLTYNAPWTMARGTTLDSILVTFNGQSRSTATGTFNSYDSGSLTISTTATDKRGRSATTSKSINVLGYAPVSLTNITIERGTVNTRLKVTLYTTVQNFNSNNQHRIIIKTRLKGASVWDSPVVSQIYSGGASNVLRTFEPTNTYTTTASYDVMVTLEDELTSMSVQETLGTTGVTFVIGKGSVGINKIPVTGRDLDVAGNIWSNNQNLTSLITGALPLSGGTMSGRITIPSGTGLTVNSAAGSWVSGKTGTDALNFSITNNSSYFTFLRGASYNGHYITLGGLGDGIGFQGYKASRVDNGTDWRFYFNVGTGALYHDGVSSSFTALSATTGAFTTSLKVGATDVALVGHKHATGQCLGSTTLSNNGTATFTDANLRNIYIVYAWDTTLSAWIPVVVTANRLGTKFAHRLHGDTLPFSLSRSGTTHTLKREGGSSVTYMVDTIAF